MLRLTGDIRRNIAYTTNARIVRHEVEADADNTQRIRLIVQSDGSDALLLNITPRLGFNRYIQPDRRHHRRRGAALARLVCGRPAGERALSGAVLLRVVDHARRA